VATLDHKLLNCAFGVLLMSLLALPAAVPADLREIEVERDENRYRVNSEAYFAASRKDMYRVLTNYDLFEQFSSVYVEARNIEKDDQGRPRFFTRMQGCLLFFCRSFVRQGHLLLTPHSEILAVAEPEQSDFEYSRERWRLTSEGVGTRLQYDLEMQPSFWVPPLIGPYVIRRSLRANAADAADRIEALALGRTPAR
jgi:hypothetical protein